MELETLVMEHPGISEAGVTSIPDDVEGELPVVYVVKKPDVTLSEEEVKDFVAGNVVKFT